MVWLCGDSITSGTGASLPSGGNGAHCPNGNSSTSYSGVFANLLGVGYDVWDAGYPGTIGAGGVGSASWFLVEYSSGWSPKPDFITIMLGTNDSTESFTSTSNNYRSGIAQIITQAKIDYPGCKFLLMTPPYYNGALANSVGGFNTNSTSQGRITGQYGHSENYDAQLASLDNSWDIFYGGVSNWNFFQAKDNAGLYSTVIASDDFHPNDAGHSAIASNFNTAFQRMLARLPVLSSSPRRMT